MVAAHSVTEISPLMEKDMWMKSLLRFRAPRTVFSDKRYLGEAKNYDADSLNYVVSRCRAEYLKPLVDPASESMNEIMPYQLSVELYVFAVPDLEVRS